MGIASGLSSSLVMTNVASGRLPRMQTMIASVTLNQA
jgi:hypothetical protein